MRTLRLISCPKRVTGCHSKTLVDKLLRCKTVVHVIIQILFFFKIPVWNSYQERLETLTEVSSL